MTYLPTKTTAAATALTDADTLAVTQGGAARTATLLTLKTFVLGGSTGATGGSTGSTGSSGATGGTSGESAEGATVTTVGPAITTAAGIKYTITSGAQVAINGTPDTATANVNLLLYHNHQAYQRNAAGEYYTSGSTTKLDQYAGTVDPTTSGSTGATGGSTGSTGGTGGTMTGSAPAGRLGYPAPSTVARNNSTSVVPVTVPPFPTRSLPAYTAYNSSESPNGKVLDASNYSTDSITYRDGTKLTLVPSSQAGLFSIRINGNPMAGRVDLVSFDNKGIDDAKQVVYWYHRSYFQTDHGLGDTTWFVIEGDQSPMTDCDTEGDDPRKSWLIADVVAPVGDPPYGLGSHAGSVGDEQDNRYGNHLREFIRSIGNSSYVNTFSDGGNFSVWGDEAGAAAADLYNQNPNKNCIPVWGIVMARGGNALNDYNAFANGDYDAYVSAGIKKYLAVFDEVHARPGYESNGTFMNWFWGGQNGDTTLNGPWLAAYKRIITVARQAGAEMTASTGKKKTVLSVWNPCHQSYNVGTSPRNMYPGNDYVDYHGLDIYSPQYAQDESNWKDGGFYSGDKAHWTVAQALEPINRIHFWDYPAAKFGIGGKNETGGTDGWGMQDAIAFAKQCGKPLAFPECGAGQNFADAGLGPVEDYVFPYYLRSRCDQAVNMGVPILYLNIWCADEKDGGWGCLFRQRARTQYAWSNAFGGTGVALVALGGSGTNTSTGSTGSTGGSTGATGGATGTTGSTGTAAGVATVTVKDTAGHTADLTLNAGYKTYYQNETGLGLDIYYYSDTGNGNKPTIGSSADSQVASLAITQNGTATVSSPGLAGVTTYSGSGSTASTGSTGGSGGNPVAAITDTSGHTATLTLTNPGPDNNRHTYYGSDTGLAANIDYFYGADGNLYVDASAEGVIASVTLTRNGSTVTSLMPNTTYN